MRLKENLGHLWRFLFNYEPLKFHPLDQYLFWFGVNYKMTKNLDIPQNKRYVLVLRNLTDTLSEKVIGNADSLDDIFTLINLREKEMNRNILLLDLKHRNSYRISFSYWFQSDEELKDTLNKEFPLETEPKYIGKIEYCTCSRIKGHARIYTDCTVNIK